MKFVDLRTGYLLFGFSDFETAFAASEELCGRGFKVAYLNEAGFVRESEVKTFVRSMYSADTTQYQNYHYQKTEHAKLKAKDSLQTAQEVLEEKTQSKAKFIMIVAPKTEKINKRSSTLSSTPAKL